MSKESGKELSLRYLPFKGKKDEWEMWSAKFLSKVRKKRYIKMLTGETTVAFEDEDNKTTEEIAKEKLNDEAFDDLITSMEDKVAFNKVNQVKTKTLKNGCAKTGMVKSSKQIQAEINTDESRAETKVHTVKARRLDKGPR